jgi:predicted acetyltransferase
MTEFKRLPERDYTAFTDLIAEAYPGLGFGSPESRERFRDDIAQLQEADPIGNVYGAYREGALVGGLACYDFEMQLHAARVPTGGIGMVATGLLHKKEKVARDIIAFFLERYDQAGAPLVALYPFRPGFYRKMGFGYGTRAVRYSLLPAALPRGESKAHLVTLGEADHHAIMACYARYMDGRHGMLTRRPPEFERMINSRNVALGYRDDGGRLRGYLVCKFEDAAPHNPFKYNLLVRELVAPDRAVLGEFCTFLHTQADQVNRVLLTVQDDTFVHLLADPRDDEGAIFPPLFHSTGTAGVGMMVRVLSVPRLIERLAGHDFGGQTCILRVTLTDSFFPANAGSTVIRFEQGRATLPGSAHVDAEVGLDVAEFSSLVYGAIGFRQLYDYGLAEISDPAWVGAVDSIFRAPRPMCLTIF